MNVLVGSRISPPPSRGITLTNLPEVPIRLRFRSGPPPSTLDSTWGVRMVLPTPVSMRNENGPCLLTMVGMMRFPAEDEDRRPALFPPARCMGRSGDAWAGRARPGAAWKEVEGEQFGDVVDVDEVVAEEISADKAVGVGQRAGGDDAHRAIVIFEIANFQADRRTRGRTRSARLDLRLAA